ncbi:MAG: fumarylacetoacetate hydrolase family protein [Candidatus Symbiothrix sp.]|jgi:2-keto-4-pentenoate hydratase/2-oxohepta-3-ene-1,7-dioic acid hydratase in catechol pathway|nr:fumarylacetoacetate hydrolase family protein [Candidatus Symbiothrix sp.]
MKLFCVGMNYAAHNKELHTESLKLKEPAIFMKPDTALLRGGKPFYIPNFSSDMQYETEIVLRICRLGKNISPKFAHRYFDEVTVGIDLTARDLQQTLRAGGLPWEISKAFDNSAVVGEFVPIDSLNTNIDQLPFHLDINGQTVQQGTTADMLFKFDEIVAYISQFFTLKIGDLVYTGTPAGVGQIHIDDHLEGYIGTNKLLDFQIK